MTNHIDRSPDDRLSLPGVTLVAVSSIAVDSTLRAMRRSMRECQFGKALFLSDQRPAIEPGEPIEWHPIPAITSRDAYSGFMLGELHQYIGTRHALCVQWDGYVLQASGWNAAFLDYDYIGAPWPHFDDAMTVGNGGFSLRSQRLLTATANLPRQRGEAEDVTICRTHRRNLEANFGLRFAPLHLARQFSFERYRPTGEEFGFHGCFNLAELVDHNELKSIFGSLENQVLALSELKELWRWALRRFHWPMAMLLLRRIRARRGGRA